jgi:Sulfotransferase domain
MITTIKNNLSLWGLAPDKLLGRIGNQAAPKILANSIPKSGTHLLERLLYLLPGITRQIAHTFLTQERPQLFRRQCARLKRGQFLVCHLWYDDEYLKMVSEFGIKPLLLIRDPRDIVISNANYITYVNKKHHLHDYFANHLKNDKERLHCCIKGNQQPTEYSISYVLEKFYPWTQCQNVLTLRFRDLIGEHGGGSVQTQKACVDRVLDFIGVPLDEKKKRELMENVFYTRSKTFNKGRINQWETRFDEEDKRLFKEVAGDWLIKYGYERDFSW